MKWDSKAWCNEKNSLKLKIENQMKLRGSFLWRNRISVPLNRTLYNINAKLLIRYIYGRFKILYDDSSLTPRKLLCMRVQRFESSHNSLKIILFWGSLRLDHILKISVVCWEWGVSARNPNCKGNWIRGLLQLRSEFDRIHRGKL